MKLLIENPADEVIKKLNIKEAFIEEDLEGIVIKEVVNIYQGSLGLVVKFRTHNIDTDLIELLNSDCSNIDLFMS